jgi:hypothetical protein
MAKLSRLSTEYVWQRVTASQSLAGASAEIAFMDDGLPIETDWEAAEIVTEGAATWVRILVGPGAGGLVLPAGTYTVWVRLTDNPEAFVRNVGSLVIE